MKKQKNSRFFMLFEVEQRKRKSNNKTRKDGFNRESAMKYPTAQKPNLKTVDSRKAVGESLALKHRRRIPVTELYRLKTNREKNY